MGRPMGDEEAADFYAEAANQGFDPTRVIRPGPLGGSIPVRFPVEMLEEVQAAADTEGITVSEWVRRAVGDALAQRSGPEDGATAIARELERLARKLRRSA